VWADETHDVPNILRLYASATEQGKFLIIDPKENNRILETWPDYNAAKLWLLEDEFTLVNGRMFNE
jgi:hypothetical protein